MERREKGSRTAAKETAVNREVRADARRKLLEDSLRRRRPLVGASL